MSEGGLLVTLDFARTRAKTFNELYVEAGVTNLYPFNSDRSDVSCAGLRQDFEVLRILERLPAMHHPYNELTQPRLLSFGTAR